MDGQRGSETGASYHYVSYSYHTTSLCYSLTVHSSSESDGSQLDYRPSSLVKIEGNQIHPFFNFLLNYQLGNTSGMPATLLSPVAFKGAILSSLKVTFHMLLSLSIVCVCVLEPNW